MRESDARGVSLPAMSVEQEAAWHALVELTEVHPRDWCLIGGQMVALHAYEHGRHPPRFTTDADLVIDARASRNALESITSMLIERGFVEDGVCPEGVGHRYVRGRAALDVLLPEGLGERGPGGAARRTTTGARSLEVSGSTQALGRAQLVTVELNDGTIGRLARPSLLGAIVAKAAAAQADTGLRGAVRHLTDVAFLCSLVTGLRVMRSETTKKDRQRLTYVQQALEGHSAWLDVREPERAQSVLRVLTTPPPVSGATD